MNADAKETLGIVLIVTIGLAMFAAVMDGQSKPAEAPPPQKQVESCDWMYEKARRLAIKWSSEETEYINHDEAQISTMWAQLYMACLEKNK